MNEFLQFHFSVGVCRRFDCTILSLSATMCDNRVRQCKPVGSCCVLLTHVVLSPAYSRHCSVHPCIDAWIPVYGANECETRLTVLITEAWLVFKFFQPQMNILIAWSDILSRGKSIEPQIKSDRQQNIFLSKSFTLIVTNRIVVIIDESARTRNTYSSDGVCKQDTRQVGIKLIVEGFETKRYQLNVSCQSLFLPTID